MATPIRLGIDSDGKNVWVDPKGSATSYLISGKTRSGKSALLYSMLAQLSRDPSVTIAGIDPTGIVFSALRDVPDPTLRVSTVRDPQDIKQVMQRLVDIMDQRIDALLASRLDKLTDFTPDVPLIVVVLEEYAGLMHSLQAADRASGGKVADRTATAVESSVLRLASEGEKAGIRLIISTQHPSSEVLSTGVRSQMVNRISFSQGSIGLSMVHEDLPDALKSAAVRFLAGEAITELAGAPPIRFRADYATYQDYIRLVDDAVERRERALEGVESGGGRGAVSDADRPRQAPQGPYESTSACSRASPRGFR